MGRCVNDWEEAMVMEEKECFLDFAGSKKDDDLVALLLLWKYTDQRQNGERKGWSGLQGTVHCGGKLRQECIAETNRGVLLTACFQAHLQLLFLNSPGLLPRDSTSHSALGPPTLINNQKMLPPQAIWWWQSFRWGPCFQVCQVDNKTDQDGAGGGREVSSYSESLVSTIF